MKNTDYITTVQPYGEDKFLHYVCQNQRKKQGFIDIATLSEVRASFPEVKQEMHSNNYYQIIWFCKGDGVLTINFQDYHIQDNTMVFISPEQLHIYQSQNQEEGISLMFSGNFLHCVQDESWHGVEFDMFNKYSKAHLCYVGKGVRFKLLNIAIRLKEEIEGDGSVFGSYEMRKSLLHEFLVLVKRHGRWNDSLDSEPDSVLHSKYLRFADCLENHFREMHTVNEYVDAMGVPEHILLQSTHIYANLTPLKMIHRRIVDEAKRMLVGSDLRVRQISEYLGFSDVSYFNKVFKRIERMTPAEFRKRW